MVQVEEHKRTENLKRAKWRFEQATLLVQEAGLSLMAAGVERADLEDVEDQVRELRMYSRQVSEMLDDPNDEGGPSCPCERPVCRCRTAPDNLGASAIVDLGVLRASFERYAQNLTYLAEQPEVPQGTRTAYRDVAGDICTLLAVSEGQSQDEAWEALVGCPECKGHPCGCQFSVETKEETA